MGNALLSSKTVIEEEASTNRPITGVATAILAIVGITEKGPIGTPVRCTSVSDYRRVFGSYVAAGDVAQSVDAFFANGGQTCDVVRTVHYTDTTVPASKTSAAAELVLNTSALAAVAGASVGTATFPLALVPGGTLVIDIDAGGPATATFDAAGASRESAAGPFALTNGMTLIVDTGDGHGAQTVTLLTANFASIGAATVSEVAAVLAGQLLGAAISLTSGATKATITTDKQGTGASLNVIGGTANAQLGFTTGALAGTGDVSDILAVTFDEAKTVVEADVPGSTFDLSGSYPRIRSNTTGASSSVLVGASSTLDTAFGFDNATHVGNDTATLPTLKLAGKYDGTYANAIQARIQAPSNGEAGRFNLQVIRNGVVLETWVNLSMDEEDDNFAETVLNDPNLGSAYISVLDLDAATSATLQVPTTGTFGPLAGGNDGLAGIDDNDFVGNVGAGSARTGIRTLDVVPDISLLALPGRATPAVHLSMITYCETERGGSMFALLDPPAGATAEGIVSYVTTTAAISGLTEYAAIYWPNLYLANPDKSVFGKDAQLLVPPSCLVAGVMSRNDAARDGGIYDAPAGTENGILRNVLGFETDECLDERKRDLVYPKRINPLTTGTGLPRFIDGSRTLKGDGNFPSVSERRGVIFIEQSIKQGTQYARHRNNDDTLRENLSKDINKFLGVQMINGAFRSKKKAEAYTIDIGSALNGPSTVFANRVYGAIGLATQKPAEFIIFRFSQDTRSLDQAS